MSRLGIHCVETQSLVQSLFYVFRMSSSPDKENSQISKIEIDANETTEKDVTSVDIQQNLVITVLFMLVT